MTEILNEILERLKEQNPIRVILFGSQVQGPSDGDSDIDIVVILEGDYIPKTYDQKLALKVKVRDSIYDLSEQYPIDIVLYTEAEWERIGSLGTSFFNEIIETGRVIYEKAGSELAPSDLRT